MGITQYGSNLLITAVLDNTPSLYMALATSAVDEWDDGSSITEPSDAAYTRMPVEMGSENWTDVENGESLYSQAITFPVAEASWTSVQSWALCTAAEGGELVLWGNFSTWIDVPIGSSAMIPEETIGILIGG